MLLEKNIANSTQWSRRDLIALVQARGKLQQQLFEQARAVRQAHGMDQVVLRGVIEISNYCQKNCDYCAMRCSNKVNNKYRLSPDVIMEIATEIKQAGISTVFLQSGQDPHCDSILMEVIPAIKQELQLDVLLCLGEKPQRAYQTYRVLGADSYILKFETSSAALYRDIAHTSLERRLQCGRWIKEAGLKLGTGNIVGLPDQTIDTLVDDIRLAVDMQPDFVSSAPFIPNEGTPLERLSYGDLDLTLNIMAIWRILLKNCLMPTVSALEKIRPSGQLMGLNAGANVITINFTPTASREKYSIYSKDRFIVSLEHAMDIISRAGLQPQVPVSNTVVLNKT